MANILVVENNRCIVDLLEEILVSDGHKVTPVQSGAQAAQLLKKRPYDIAFIDLGLPDMDGITLIEDLKKQANPAIPIVISGRSDFDSAVKAFRAGARDYILKPFDIEDILRIAKDATAGKNNRTNGNHRHGMSGPANINQIIGVVLNQLLNPLIVAFSFLVGLAIQHALLPYQAPLTPALIKQLLFLAISMGFCWGFIAHFYREENNSDKTRIIKNRAYRLAATHLLFGTILFFVFPLANCRPAMFGSYGIGLVLLIVNSLYISPRILARLIEIREGRKRIVIIGRGQKADSLHTHLQKQFGARRVERIQNHESIIQSKNSEMKSSEQPTELRLEGGSLNHEEINRLITDFGGSRIIINVPENKPQPEKYFAQV
jgi:CheY-like chemotaxis protein